MAPEAKGATHAYGYDRRPHHGYRVRDFRRHIVLGGPAYARGEQLDSAAASSPGPNARPVAAADSALPALWDCNAEQQVGRTEYAVRHVFVSQLQNHHQSRSTAEEP